MKRVSIDYVFSVVLVALIGLSFLGEQSGVVSEEAPVVTKSLLEKQAWELAGVPDFPAITDVREKKKQFFQYILPMVLAENQRITKQRNRLMALQSQSSHSEDDAAWLKQLGRQYRQAGKLDAQWFTTMLLRVDALPPSLALAQAANESGWGGSRFARQGNNYFGQWCFSKGCGLVPSSRNSGSIHEVQKFASVDKSVNAYIRNLNTHVQYTALRELRANARNNGLPVTGPYLAQGLGKYSERGYAYVDEIIAMINGNRLARFDH